MDNLYLRHFYVSCSLIVIKFTPLTLSQFKSVRCPTFFIPLWKFLVCLRDRSQILVRGPDAKKKKKIIAKSVRVPLSNLKNLFDMKTMGQPNRKSYKLNFPRKICGHFFKAPLWRVKNFKNLPFCILTNVCERSLIIIHLFYHILFAIFSWNTLTKFINRPSQKVYINQHSSLLQLEIVFNFLYVWSRVGVGCRGEVKQFILISILPCCNLKLYSICCMCGVVWVWGVGVKSKSLY